MMIGRHVICAIAGVLATSLAAEDVPVTRNANFMFNGESITISRSAEVNSALLAKLSEAPTDCAEPCISPMIAAPGVETLGELDVIDFLSGPVASGEGLLIDARHPADRAIGHIAASVNVPAETVAPDNPFQVDILKALGAEALDQGYDFSGAFLLVIYDGGPGNEDARAFVTHLIGAGYPAEKLAYYRGGMLVWTTLGLSTVEGE